MAAEGVSWFMPNDVPNGNVCSCERHRDRWLRFSAHPTRQTCSLLHITPFVAACAYSVIYLHAGRVGAVEWREDSTPRTDAARSTRVRVSSHLP